MDVTRIDLNQLPNATSARFATFLTISILIAFTFSQNITLLPLTSGPTSYNASFLNGAAGGVAALLAAVLLYLLHPWLRRRSFGPCTAIEPSHVIALRVKGLCEKLEIDCPRLLIDQDIRNYDALAFGLPGRKTVLMGRGLLLCQAIRPDEFDARMAHELGHIRNKDIGVTFLAQGLITVSLGLFAAVMLQWFGTSIIHLIHEWQRWQAAGVSSLWFLQFWLPWVGHTLLRLAFLILQILFWAFILIAEHRAFLRIREFYADNASAVAAGPDAIKKAIGITSDGAGVKVWSQIYESWFSAHPGVQARRLMVDSPTSLLKPKPLSLAALGYIMGLMLSTIQVISSSPDLPGDATANQMVQGFFVSLDTGIIVLFLSAVSLPPTLSILSLILRTSTWLFLDRQKLWAKVKLVLLACSLLAIGLLAGTLINPINVEYIVLSGSVKYNLLEFNQALFIFGLSVNVVVGIALSYFIVRRLLTGVRLKRPSRFLRVGITFLFYLCLAYSNGAVLAMYDPHFFERDDAAIPTLIMILIAIIFWIISYLFARRSLSFRPQNTNAIAPWLRAKA